MLPTVKELFISDLEAGMDCQAPFFVASQNQGRTNRGGVYLNLDLRDQSGQIAAKVWDNAEKLAPQLQEGSVSLVRGYVDSYRGQLQLVVRDAHQLSADEIDWSDYLRASRRPVAELKTQLWTLVDSLTDQDFHHLLTQTFTTPEVSGKFYDWPAAKSMHHAYLHGLLEHSVSVGALAAQVAEHYELLDRDLLISGALLHDLGKIWEFTPMPQVDYTTLGRLKGHLTLGSEFLGDLAREIAFPPDKLELLQHILLSHHGEPEFGAPVRPQLLEALVVHHLDNIDAKIEAIDTFLTQDTNEEGWSNYHRLFGSYFRRTPSFDKTPPEAPEPEKPLVIVENSTKKQKKRASNHEANGEQQASSEQNSDEQNADRLF